MHIFPNTFEIATINKEKYSQEFKSK